jgi:hypothetical protein
MLAVGYPDMEPKPRHMRPKVEMVHYDSYDISKFRTDEQIEEFIADVRRRRRQQN